MICVACLKDLDEFKECVGECIIYRSDDRHTLCEPCFLDEDEALFELAGTNDLPFMLDIYNQAWQRKKVGDFGNRPTQLYQRYEDANPDVKI